MKKPWFWKARNGWYVKSGVSQVFLSTDEKEAYEIWQELVAAANPDLPNTPFEVLAHAYLLTAKNSVSEGQYARSELYLTDFSAFATGPARQIKPYDVTRWLELHPQ